MRPYVYKLFIKYLKNIHIFPETAAIMCLTVRGTPRGKSKRERMLI